MKPRILLVTTRRWFSAARLAMAFSAAGCRVEIACPANHPVMLIRDIAARHPFGALAPLRSLHSAIGRSLPDLIVPTDDVALGYLHRLHEQAPSIDESTSSFVRLLLSRSMGEPDSFSIVSSRTKFLAAAQAEGIEALPTEEIPDLQALSRWFATNSLPAVLKADGTSGGEGVKIVRTEEQGRRAWRKLHAPVGLAHVIKKTCCERDPHHIVPWVRRRRRAVSIQPFVHGDDSNVAVACWKGELLGTISLDVLRAWRPKGPASLVELSQNDEMIAAARTLVRRLRLSGLCGFDFITDHATGRTRLIEINARATQTCHLPHGIPRDLIGSLVSALAGRSLPALNQARRRGIIALFPLAWKSGIPSEMLDSTHHDIPWEEPLLVQAGFAEKDKSLYEKCLQMWARIHPPRAFAGEAK
ncbi:MAG TPA: ATP-grasp domain-containing protein [Silvibacterium sp.]|nr:ATP-grasp domain-containing protein [Silvibacterium sp.]